jgi:hypothetical protein
VTVGRLDDSIIVRGDSLRFWISAEDSKAEGTVTKLGYRLTGGMTAADSIATDGLSAAESKRFAVAVPVDATPGSNVLALGFAEDSARNRAATSPSDGTLFELEGRLQLSAATVISADGRVATASAGPLLVDDARRRVYVANSRLDRIDVYSMDDRAFLQPINVSKAPWAMDMSAAVEELLVTDQHSASISIIDLTSVPATVSDVALPLTGNESQVDVVVLANNEAWITVNNAFVECPMLTLDLQTHAVDRLTSCGDLNHGGSAIATRSGDGRHVLVANTNSSGLLYWYDSQTMSSQSALLGPGISNLFMNGSGTHFVANDRIYDSSMTQIAQLQVCCLQEGAFASQSAEIVFGTYRGAVGIADVSTGELKELSGDVRDGGGWLDMKAVALSANDERVFMIAFPVDENIYLFYDIPLATE